MSENKDMVDKRWVQKVVLAAVVMHEKKVLVVQRGADEDILPNIWELPSGKREPQENSLNSLQREILEETGLDVDIVMPVSVFDYQVEKGDEIRDSTQINFLVTPKGSTQVMLSSEHQDYAWIQEAELADYDLTGPVAEAIQKSFSIASGVLLPK